MHDFIRCNKIAGVHWLKRSVDQLIIKVKLKLPDDIISLPKFEDYVNETSNLNLEQNTEEFSFRWQEKSFSAYELKHYSDVHNCLTENEFRYHELLKNSEIVPKKVFTYIHEDYFMPLPQEKREIDSNFLDDAVGKLGDVFGRTGSEKQLFKSQEDICDGEEQWTAMHIVFDASDSNEDTPLRQETKLVSIYHNIVYNYIIIYPDMNNETNLYDMEDASLGYHYEVHVDFGGDDDDDELCTLLSNLYKKWEKKHKSLVNFVMPPFGKKQYYINLDITSAVGFEMDNLCVEYNIKLPDGVESKDTLHGRTHVSAATDIDGADVCHFGYLMELRFESDSAFDPTPLKIYLEIISIDTWHRHRTEGYCYFTLPFTPGGRTQELKCVRPDEGRGEERRFYVGGCHLIEDLEVLSNAELQPGNYTYVATGSVSVRAQVTVQTRWGAPAAGPARAAAWLRGAGAALHRYHEARDRLTAATATD